MKRRLTRTATLLTALLVLVGCSLLPTSRTREALDNEPTPTPIPTSIVPIKPTYTVQRGEVVRTMQFLGRVAPVVETSLFFNVSGRVRNVFVRRGDMVAAGQTLADLEIDDLERELAAAQLNVERAEARLATAQADLESQRQRAELNVQIAQLNLQITQARDLTPRQTLAAAELDAAQLALTQAQAAYDAAATAGNDTSAEAAALQQAKVNLARAQAAYDAVLQDIAVHTLDIAVKEKQVALAQIALAEMSAGVDPLLINDVQQARLAVERLEAAIADAKIVAPFDGRVMFLALAEGQNVDAYKPVAIVADLNALEVRADLTGSTVQELVEGMAVTVVLSDRPSQPLNGFIRRLPYTSSDEDRSTRVALDEAAADTGFEVGDLARVTVVLERREDTLWLPPQAIRTFEGRKFVVVQEGDVQRRVDVKVGIEGNERVEIVEGLTEGQTVIAP